MYIYIFISKLKYVYTDYLIIFRIFFNYYSNIFEFVDNIGKTIF